MKPSHIDHFFKLFSEQTEKPIQITLIGGAAALLLGGSRPTLDVDFAFSSKASFEEIETALQKPIQETQIQAQYSEDIERWSMISLIDYKKHTRFYKKFGDVTVSILEPEYWSIGKIARYYDSDVEDMIAVFKKQKTDPSKLTEVWERALQDSPRSDDLFHFKKHREHFLKTYGKSIWGKSFEPEKIPH